MLGWSQKQLADNAGVGFATVQRAERSEGPIGGMVETAIKLQQTFESAGITFLSADKDGGPGVRIRSDL